MSGGACSSPGTGDSHGAGLGELKPARTSWNSRNGVFSILCSNPCTGALFPLGRGIGTSQGPAPRCCGVSVSASAAGSGAQPCLLQRGPLLPSSGLAVAARAQSPWKELSCVPCPSVPVWRRAWVLWAGPSVRSSIQPTAAPIQSVLSSSVVHCPIAVWMGKQGRSGHQVASPTAREQMVPSATFALGNISSGGLGEDQLRAPSHALTAKPVQSA